jgi:hypothetical protein
MTLADIYHYPTQHFGFHQQQLTLDGASGGASQHVDTCRFSRRAGRLQRRGP